MLAVTMMENFHSMPAGGVDTFAHVAIDWSWGFAVLLLVGGTIGFVKAGSKISLISSALCASFIAAANLLLKGEQQVQALLALGVLFSLMFTVKHCRQEPEKRKVFPGLALVLFSGGLVLIAALALYAPTHAVAHHVPASAPSAPAPAHSHTTPSTPAVRGKKEESKEAPKDEKKEVTKEEPKKEEAKKEETAAPKEEEKKEEPKKEEKKDEKEVAVDAGLDMAAMSKRLEAIEARLAALVHRIEGKTTTTDKDSKDAPKADKDSKSKDKK